VGCIAEGTPGISASLPLPKAALLLASCIPSHSPACMMYLKTSKHADDRRGDTNHSILSLPTPRELVNPALGLVNRLDPLEVLLIPALEKGGKRLEATYHQSRHRHQRGTGRGETPEKETAANALRVRSDDGRSARHTTRPVRSA
jgi:hypothetical protein